MLKQLALCIGNDKYKYTWLNSLNCAVNDSIAVAQKLKSLGYDTIVSNNLDVKEIYSAVDEFEQKLQSYDVGLFYYAGHGFEYGGVNLLAPIDLQDGNDKYIQRNSLTLDYLVDALEGTQYPNHLKVKIIILDACREDPATRGVKVKGFAPVFAPQGTIIAFSTSPGQAAKEKNGHGCYTNALLRSLDIPRIPIENMFKHVREQLASETHGAQISWEHTSLLGNYYFNEDKMTNSCVYSPEALADAEYSPPRGSVVCKIISELKIRNYSTQKAAIAQISTINFSGASNNDLFVLGRNIYQSATGNVFSAQLFIDDFISHNNISQDAQMHLLNGMAYEIYFDAKGQLRKAFKGAYASPVIQLIEMEQYQRSKNFILNKLLPLESKILYLPGSEERIILDLDFITIDSSDGNILGIKSISFQGKNILFYADDFSDINEGDFTRRTTLQINELKSKLEEILIIPKDIIQLTFNIEITEKNVFMMPDFFSIIINK